MSGIGEASAVLGLISSAIAIFEAVQEIYDAASDASGLPKTFRTAAEQIPLVHHALNLAEKNVKAKTVTEETLQNVKPVLGRCKENATRLKEIFDKTIPGKDASRTEHLKKAMAIKMNSGKVNGYMKEIVEGMNLLAQNQVFQDAVILSDIKKAIEDLDNISENEELSHFVHSGSGAINALTGPGTQNNYNNSGAGSQYNADKQFFGRDQVNNRISIAYPQEARLSVTHKLPYSKAATFNCFDEDHTTCHPNTRVDILRQIQDWAQQSDSKSIFWLNGMAGTGKSTVSWTIAKWLTEQRRHGIIDLGASFFFKRGEGDRDNASRFFPTIARDLVLKIPGLDNLMAKVIASDPFIFEKALGEQFDKLIYQPLQKIKISAIGCSVFILVVDALDECGTKSKVNGCTTDADVILSLLSQISQITTIRLKLFLTSRPESSIQYRFNMMSVDAHKDAMLHKVPQITIEHDLSVFLRSKFSEIQKRYNARQPSEPLLDDIWPGDKVLQLLVDMAVPLFIVAATVSRYVGDLRFIPSKRLKQILDPQQKGLLGQLGQMEKMYLAILTQAFEDPKDEEEFYLEFRKIVGPIVTLAEPLSTNSLAILLNTPRHVAMHYLSGLPSVLQIPPDPEPVRTLHLSFGEFLLSDKIRGKPFWVDGPATHWLLVTKCLQLLSGSSGLRTNLCDLTNPGQSRQEVDQTVVNVRLSPALQYACHYWIHHVQRSMVQPSDEYNVYAFLREHFLHWLEALSFMDRLGEAIEQIGILQTLVSANNSIQLSAFLKDAERFILANQYIANIAPLQIYSSAIIFAPQTSIVRNLCGQFPTWMSNNPNTPATWSPELQKLEGHTDVVKAVAFSSSGSVLASASTDNTVRLWNPRTGREIQKLEGHTDMVEAVSFHSDTLLASASCDRTVRIWNIGIKRELCKLKGHTDAVLSVSFSHKGSLLASASRDQTIRLWNPQTYDEVKKLEGHTSWVSSVVFSPDDSLLASASADYTIRIWQITTMQELRKIRAYSSGALAFSPDGLLLASSSFYWTACLWDPFNGQEVKKIKGCNDERKSVAFSPDGSLLLSTEGNTTGLWNLATSQKVQDLEGHTNLTAAAVFSPDGSLVASASMDGTIRLWDPTTIQERGITGHDSHITSVTFSPDISLLASTSADGTVIIWQRDNGQAIRKLKGHTRSTTTAAFSPDGSLLASGSRDSTIILWHVATWKPVQKLKGHTSFINAVAFSPNGSQLASASFDQKVIIWNSATGRPIQTLLDYSASVDAVVYSPNGLLLAVALADTSIELWDLVTDQQIRKLVGHSQEITAVAFSPDGSLLVSTSRDLTARLWNPVTGQEVRNIMIFGPVECTGLTIDNRVLLSNRGTICLDKKAPGDLNLESSTQKTIMIKNDWIQLDKRNLLWLPQEYRSSCTAFSGNVFAIGRQSGQVIFIEIDKERFSAT